MEALQQGNYPDAVAFFKEALLINPNAQDSQYFLNTIIRIQQGRFRVIEYEQSVRDLKQRAAHKLKYIPEESYFDYYARFQDKDEAASLDVQEPGQDLADETIKVKEDTIVYRNQFISETLDTLELIAGQRAADKPDFFEAQEAEQEQIFDEREEKEILNLAFLNREPAQVHSKTPQTPPIPQTENLGTVTLGELDTLYLDDRLWNESDGRPTIEIELGRSIILEGRNIERFLIVTPGFIKAERIDRDRIVVAAGQRGRTTFLVWEDFGRWSFNVQVVFPFIPSVRPEQDFRHQESRPFRFQYFNDWATFYSDQESGRLQKRSLTFLQRMNIDGESPYGDLDAYVLLQRFKGETVATGYSVGISDGQIGPWSGFSVRGFDARKTFSPLTLSGKYFRGVLYDQKAFDDQVRFSYLTGQDRDFYSFVTRRKAENVKSFLMGGRIHFFPAGKHQYAFNYVQGWGSDRPEYLSKEVMSVETTQRLGDHKLAGEFAYDTQDFARTASWEFPLSDEMRLSLNFRDIDKSYTTIASNPSGQGEIGGITSFFWNNPHFSLDSYFNIYKDRLNVNPQDPYAYNYDFATTLRKPIDERTSFSTSFYWLDTPGLMSPHRSFRVNNYLSRTFRFFEQNRLGSAFIRQSYQRSRYAYSPLSEYDRIGAAAGIRFPVPFIENLTYFLNYEHYFVTETFSKQRSQPHVISSGFNYSRELTDNVYATLGVSYRNEQETESNFSFLAGEDSAVMTAGLTYSPHPDFNLYIDGAARQIWPEAQNRKDYFEADLRVGARFSWEMPFRWNPQGYISGVVFKDSNQNGRQDFGEEGIAGVKLTVGREKVITDELGRYFIKVKGKKVQVSVDLESIPSGYVFTTPILQEVEIIPHQVVKADFGFSTRSGVYGVVYFDKNQTNRPDQGDEFISGVRIFLNGKQAVSNHEGAYFFDNIEPGRHEIVIDVNSFPLEYLPMVRLRNFIDVQEGTTYIFHIPVDKK